MKNTIKNMVVTGILASVMMVGATSAHAGLLVSDRSAVETQACTESSQVSDGTTSSVESQPCTQNADSSTSYLGLLVSDLTSTVSTAFAGLLVSD